MSAKQRNVQARAQLDKHKRKGLDESLQQAPPEDTKAVASLLDQGADPNAPRKGKSHSALYNAASAGAINTIIMLLECGAMIDADGGPYHTALKGAILRGQYDAMVTLLDKGADPNHKDGFADMTPLGLAIKERRKDMVAVLLQYGADVNKRVVIGVSPVAFVSTSCMCKHKTQKPSCKKCQYIPEWREIMAMLQAFGGTNSVDEAVEKLSNFLSSAWDDDGNDSDPDVRKAKAELRKALAEKKAREAKKAEERRRREEEAHRLGVAQELERQRMLGYR